MKFDIVGHRGYPRVAPENTIASFKAAFDAGADCVEMDVHQAKDGELVIMHDKSLWRTTGHPGNINHYRYEQLAKLDAGSWFNGKFRGERIPTLRDVFSLDGGKARFYVEVKDGSPTYPGIEERIVGLMSEMGVTKRCVAISFNQHIVERMKKAEPKLMVGKLFLMGLLSPVGSMSKKVDYICPFWPSINRNTLDSAHDKKAFVNAWTVNSTYVMKYLAEWKVDSITTESVEECYDFRQGG